MNMSLKKGENRPSPSPVTSGKPPSNPANYADARQVVLDQAALYRALANEIDQLNQQLVEWTEQMKQDESDVNDGEYRGRDFDLFASDWWSLAFKNKNTFGKTREEIDAKYDEIDELKGQIAIGKVERDLLRSNLPALIPVMSLTLQTLSQTIKEMFQKLAKGQKITAEQVEQVMSLMTKVMALVQVILAELSKKKSQQSSDMNNTQIEMSKNAIKETQREVAHQKAERERAKALQGFLFGLEIVIVFITVVISVVTAGAYAAPGAAIAASLEALITSSTMGALMLSGVLDKFAQAIQNLFDDPESGGAQAAGVSASIALSVIGTFGLGLIYKGLMKAATVAITAIVARTAAQSIDAGLTTASKAAVVEINTEVVSGFERSLANQASNRAATIIQRHVRKRIARKVAQAEAQAIAAATAGATVEGGRVGTQQTTQVSETAVKEAVQQMTKRVLKELAIQDIYKAVLIKIKEGGILSLLRNNTQLMKAIEEESAQIAKNIFNNPAVRAKIAEKAEETVAKTVMKASQKEIELLATETITELSKIVGCQLSKGMFNTAALVVQEFLKEAVTKEAVMNSVKFGAFAGVIGTNALVKLSVIFMDAAGVEKDSTLYIVIKSIMMVLTVLFALYCGNKFMKSLPAEGAQSEAISKEFISTIQSLGLTLTTGALGAKGVSEIGLFSVQQKQAEITKAIGEIQGKQAMVNLMMEIMHTYIKDTTKADQESLKSQGKEVMDMEIHLSDAQRAWAQNLQPLMG